MRERDAGRIGRGDEALPDPHQRNVGVRVQVLDQRDQRADRRRDDDQRRAL